MQNATGDGAGGFAQNGSDAPRSPEKQPLEAYLEEDGLEMQVPDALRARVRASECVLVFCVSDSLRRQARCPK